MHTDRSPRGLCSLHLIHGNTRNNKREIISPATITIQGEAFGNCPVISTHFIGLSHITCIIIVQKLPCIGINAS